MTGAITARTTAAMPSNEKTEENNKYQNIL